MNQLMQLVMVALTVAMEAGGEPYEGKLGVAWVIRNRAIFLGRSYTDIVLQRKWFSCWNEDSPTRLNLDRIPDHVLAESLAASLEALFLLKPDPTNGAYFYLNPVVANPLPGWWSTDTDPASQIAIGKHLFRRRLQAV